MLKIKSADYYPEQSSGYIKGIKLDYNEETKTHTLLYDFSIRITEKQITAATLTPSGAYTCKALPLIREPGCNYSIKNRKRSILTDMRVEQFTRLLSDELYQIWITATIDNIIKNGRKI